MCDQMVPPPHNTRPVNVYRHSRSYIGRVAPTKYDAALSPLNLWRPHVRMSMVSISRLSGISWSCSCLSRLSASLIANAALLWPEPTDACITIRTGAVSVSRVGAVSGTDADASPCADVASGTSAELGAVTKSGAGAEVGAVADADALAGAEAGCVLHTGVFAGAVLRADVASDAVAVSRADVASDAGVRVLAAVQAEASAAEGAMVVFVCLQVSMKSIIA